MEDICCKVWGRGGVARAKRTDVVIVMEGGNLHIGVRLVVEGSKAVTKSSWYLRLKIIWRGI